MLLLYWFNYIYFDCFGYHQTLMDYDMEDCLSATFLNKLQLKQYVIKQNRICGTVFGTTIAS